MGTDNCLKVSENAPYSAGDPRCCCRRRRWQGDFSSIFCGTFLPPAMLPIKSEFVKRDRQMSSTEMGWGGGGGECDESQKKCVAV